MAYKFPRHTDFIHLIYGEPARSYQPEVVSIIDIIEGYSKETIPLLTRYLTTGTPEAREDIRVYVLEMIAHFQHAYDDDEYDNGEYDSHAEKMDASEQRWEYAVETYSHQIIHNAVLARWNTSNVLAETGIGFTVSNVIRTASPMKDMLRNACAGLKGVISEDEEARGITALTLARMLSTEPLMLDAAQFPGFIQWAGSHENIGSVINLASERRTFHHETLQDILLEQTGKPALGSGVL